MSSPVDLSTPISQVGLVGVGVMGAPMTPTPTRPTWEIGVLRSTGLLIREVSHSRVGRVVRGAGRGRARAEPPLSCDVRPTGVYSSLSLSGSASGSSPQG